MNHSFFRLLAVLAGAHNLAPITPVASPRPPRPVAPPAAVDYRYQRGSQFYCDGKVYKIESIAAGLITYYGPDLIMSSPIAETEFSRMLFNGTFKLLTAAQLDASKMPEYGAGTRYSSDIAVFLIEKVEGGRVWYNPGYGFTTWNMDVAAFEKGVVDGRFKILCPPYPSTSAVPGAAPAPTPAPPVAPKVDWPAALARAFGGLYYWSLLRTLKAIEANDTNYDVRNPLVYLAVSQALKLGLKAGVSIDLESVDWPVAYIELPSGQVSWHLPQHEKLFDGHTTAQKYTRIQKLAEFAGYTA